MNPRAVQMETNENDQDEDEEVESALTKEACSQTDASATVKSMSPPHSVVKNYEREQFLSFLRAIYNRVDDPNARGPPSIETTSVLFETVFYEPTLLCIRTPITPTGHRIATLRDVLFDFRRCFVLYADMMTALPEICALTEADRITIAKNRFAPFYWWLACCWTAKAGCDGVCYSNGSYHPSEVSQKAFPEARNVSRLSVESVSVPLRSLDLTEAEVLIGSIYNIFQEFPRPPNISLESEMIMERGRDKYTRMMINCIPVGEPQSAIRFGTISILQASITSLKYLTSDNIEVSDVLQIVPIDDWTNDIFQARKNCPQGADM
ncbi:hypothetical protein WR25_03893 [Diploscapter pachys]|uniref:NR LBD domain-containing protein n=1 Tax=Diploscapter pachys TaxID=2018661 RepID=A0A2A2JN92_9BILA|nr:hypothetical protein WR25_03893 [Diploscapter pachys]